MEISYGDDPVTRRVVDEVGRGTLDAIISTIFGDHASAAEVVALAPGISGSYVLLIEPRGIGNQQRCVLKIGPAEESAAELRGWTSFVQPYVSNRHLPGVLGYAYQGGWGAIAYQFYAEATLEALLVSAAQRGDMAAIHDGVSQVLTVTRDWSGGRQSRFEDLTGSVYPVTDDQLAEFERVAAAGVLSRDLSTEPVSRLWRREGAQPLHRKTFRSIMHGDLHTRNVLVAPDGAICLIDFRHSGWNHAFRDLTTLEADICLRVLCSAVGNSSDIEHYTSSLGDSYDIDNFANGLSSVGGSNETALTSLGAALHPIRRAAWFVMEGQSEHLAGYQIALARRMLSMTTRPDSGLTDYQRQVGVHLIVRLATGALGRSWQAVRSIPTTKGRTMPTKPGANDDSGTGENVLHTNADLSDLVTMNFQQRHFYRKMAEAGSMSGLGRLRASLDTEEMDGDIYYSVENKAGDAPVRFDVDAQEATQLAIGKFLLDAGSNLDPIWAGEDVRYVAAHRPVPGQIVCRCDSVDGSTLVSNTWMGAASVTIVEQHYRNWARLEALSITSMTGMTISVENHTLRRARLLKDEDLTAAPELKEASGEVYFADHLTGFRARLEYLRPDRHPGSLAAVGYNSARDSVLRPYVEEAWKIRSENTSNIRHLGSWFEGRYLNAAGNPIVFGLAMGRLEAVIEPDYTTLHDSVFLAVHEILGGRIVRLDTLQRLNYIELYQAHASNLDGSATPIPPYVAFAGDAVPEWVAIAHARLTNGGSTIDDLAP